MDAGITRIFAGAGAAPSRNGTASRGGLFRRAAGDGAWEALENGLPAGAEVHARGGAGCGAAVVRRAAICA